MAQKRPTRRASYSPPAPAKEPKRKREPDPASERLAKALFRPAKFTPRTAGQRAMCEAIDSHDIAFCVGPAGSGKSKVAIAKAVEALDRGDVEKIMLFRPYVGTGRTMGFQPGDGDEKVMPYLAQLVEYLKDFHTPEHVDSLIRDKVVILGAMEFIRSQSFRRAFVIWDETQNGTLAEFRVFLSRIDEGSKLIILGDVSRYPDGTMKQCDLATHEQGALEWFADRCSRIPGIAHVAMGKADIVRHPLVKAMIEADIL